MELNNRFVVNWSNVNKDFITCSDVYRSKRMERIDAKLYAKYHLSDDKIAFIESMINPMQ